MKYLIVLTLVLTAGFVDARAEPLLNYHLVQKQEQDIQTFSATGRTQSDACSFAINLAKNGCRTQRMYNIVRVSCKCDGRSSAGIWTCVGTAICQK